MKNKQWSIFSGAVAILLVLAILPSFTALSESYTQALPELASKTGPLNPLKFLAPFLFLFVGMGVFRIRAFGERRGLLLLSGAWIIGTAFTLLAASRCGFLPMFLREWASITIGLLVGVALRLLNPGLRDRVFSGWMAILLLALVLDLFFPSSIDWLYAHIFDPETRQWDFLETGTYPLTGVFGRQSAAKLMAWVPWLFLPPLLIRFRNSIFLLAGIGVWSGFILATSQRGPMLAAFCALLVFGAHRAWSERKWKPFYLTTTAACLGFASIFVTVPSAIVGPRLLRTEPTLNPVAGATNNAQILKTSDDNANFRVKMARASLDSIRTHPLGDACIQKSFFTDYGINEGHSHNLFLEQFRSRGWIWGLIHFALWTLAGLAFFRASDLRASTYLAALTAIFICGLVDHPWFVLNQSIVLGAVLVEGVFRFFRKTSVESNAI